MSFSMCLSRSTFLGRASRESLRSPSDSPRGRNTVETKGKRHCGRTVGSGQFVIPNGVWNTAEDSTAVVLLSSLHSLARSVQGFAIPRQAGTTRVLGSCGLGIVYCCATYQWVQPTAATTY